MVVDLITYTTVLCCWHLLSLTMVCWLGSRY